MKEQLGDFVKQLQKQVDAVKLKLIRSKKESVKAEKTHKQAKATAKLKATALARNAVKKAEAACNDVDIAIDVFKTELSELQEEINLLKRSAKKFSGMAKVLTAFEKAWKKKHAQGKIKVR